MWAESGNDLEATPRAANDPGESVEAKSEQPINDRLPSTIPLDDTEAVGTKVLVAHGSTRALKHAVQELQLAGCDVIATPDGGDAFARFFEDQPQAVICSASLPSLSGINFARMVRSQSPDTQVVILSEQSIYDVPNGAFVLGEPLLMADLRRVLPNLFAERSPEAVEADLQTPVFVLAVLRRFERDSGMLQAFDEDGLRELADIAEHRSIPDGVKVIEQGEEGDGFYLVVEGQVRVTLAERDDAQIARIGPGGIFGEMALLNEKGRSASVWSAGPCTFLFFDKHRVLPLLDRYPDVREALSGVALRRTESNLWSVLFEESEVDETLAELEASLAGATEVAHTQAPTTARIVERGESLPQNDHTPPRKSDVEDTPAIDPEDTGPTSPHDEEQARRHDDPTREIAAYRPEKSGPKPSRDELQRRRRIHDSPTVQVAAYRPDDDHSQEVAALPAPIRKRSSTPSFLAGGAVGLAAGIALAFAISASLDGDPVRGKQDREPVAGPQPELSAIDQPSDTGSTEAEPGSKTTNATPDAAPTDQGPTDTAPLGGDGDGLEQATANTEQTEVGPESLAPDNKVSDQEETESAPSPRAVPAFRVEDRELTPEQEAQRKLIRKRMFAASAAGNTELAIRLGLRLRDRFRLDWEAQLKLAEAQRIQGNGAAALAAYRHFVANYSTNSYVSEARFRLAELLLARGEHPKAQRLLKRVAADTESPFASQAKSELEKLR
ncbi:MAG: cyclic nucleotide-binding domain-containing protein [Myxococcota bacterium]